MAEFQQRAKTKKGCDALASLDASNIDMERSNFKAKIDLDPSKYPAQVLKMEGGKAHLLPPSAANRLVPFCDMTTRANESATICKLRYSRPSSVSRRVSYTIKRMVVLDPTPDGESQWARPSLLSSMPEFTGLGDLKTGASGGKYAPLDPPLVCAMTAAVTSNDASQCCAVTVGYCSSEKNLMAIKFDENDPNLAAIETRFTQINADVEERKKEFFGTKKFKKDQAPRVPLVHRSEEEVEKYGTDKTVFIKTVSQETANGYSTPTAFYRVTAPPDTTTATTDPKTLVDQDSATLISMDQVGPGATVIPVAKLSKVDFPAKATSSATTSRPTTCWCLTQATPTQCPPTSPSPGRRWTSARQTAAPWTAWPSSPTWRMGRRRDWLTKLMQGDAHAIKSGGDEK